MFNSPVDEIKSRLDIVEVISSYIQLSQAGRNWKALCPFHNEKTPSFIVSPERQIWHCFGCGEGGDIFAFIMKIEGVEFRDALRILAKRAGIELKAPDRKLQSEKTRLYEICQWSSKFFIAHLRQTERGKKVKEYLKGRGFSEAVISEFQIGYAPRSWKALLNFLVSKGYKAEEIAKAGLAVKSERIKNSEFSKDSESGTNKGGYPSASLLGKEGLRGIYDRFRDRIIFPIFDLSGEVIGFGGRVMPDANEKQAKYINTPETLIYNKGRILYGLNKTSRWIRQADICILVEGYADLIASWQMGVKNVVASSGTALTFEQIRLIKRMTNNLATAFDMDSAGAAATKRSIDMAISSGMDVKVIEINKKDPADYLKEDYRQWLEAVGNAKSVMDFYFSNAFSSFDSEDIEGKKEITGILLPVIKKIPNKVEQAHWIGKLAQELRTDERILAEEMKRSASQERVRPRRDAPSRSPLPVDRIQNLQEQLLGFFLIWPRELKNLIEKTETDLFTNKENFEIFEQLKKYLGRGRHWPMSPSGLKDFTATLEPSLKDKINLLTLKAEYALGKDFEDDFDENKIPYQEAQYCLEQLKEKKIKDELKKLEKDIKKAEEEKDKETLKILTQEFRRLSQELSQLNKNL